MTNESQQAHRKDEHVALAMHFFEDEHLNDFDNVRLLPNNLPELAVSDIDLKTNLFHKSITAPIYINAMTGGSKRTGTLNAQLSKIAATLHIPMAVGSESITFKEPESLESFKVVRKNNPDGLVFANMGAGHSWQNAQRAVDLLHADALQIHINVVQEIIMPEGDRTFHWLDNLASIQAHVTVPVIVKEVGFGMTQETLQELKKIGIQNVDLAGQGGTNFAKIENARRHRHDFAYLKDLGVSTIESLLEARNIPDLQLFASGGIRQPLDMIKAFALGADFVGMSGIILHLLMKTGVDETTQTLRSWIEQLPLIMSIFGAKTMTDLRKVPIIFSPKLVNYAKQRRLKL